MSQILNLLNLSIRVQEGLLLGDLHLSERRIRALAGERQGAVWRSLLVQARRTQDNLRREM